MQSTEGNTKTAVHDAYISMKRSRGHYQFPEFHVLCGHPDCLGKIIINCSTRGDARLWVRKHNGSTVD